MKNIVKIIFVGMLLLLVAGCGNNMSTPTN